jgi:hypothetical protein
MKNKNYWHALLAVLLLSACDNSDGIIPPFDEKPITVTADVIQHSRAGYQTDVLMPEKFVMDITQNGEDKFNYSLVEMTKKGTNTYSATDGRELLWADETHTATVKAMTIPMGLTTVDGTNAMVVNVSLEQNVEANVAASDLLGATSQSNGGITIDGTNIKINFQHLLSKLDVEYSFASEVEGESVVVNSITLQDICTKGEYSYANMALASTGLSNSNIVMFHSATTNRTGKAEAIFYPYKPTTNPTLVINATIDGVECNFSCPVVPKDASNGFVSGKRYTMKVTIVGTSVSGTTASIAKGWEDGGEKDFVTE